MNDYSILFLKESNVGVRQYHFGTKLLFLLLSLLLVGAGALSWKFFEQFQTITKQRLLLEEQEKTQVAFQQRIDLYDGRESRISFLENYVDELKQATQNSGIMFKKHLALFRSNTNKLDELHNFMCQTLEAQCAPDFGDQAEPQQTVQWLEQIYQDFLLFNKSLQEFAARRGSFEEQANTIQQLRRQLVETEQDLSEHMEFLKANQATVSRLTKKISKTTGITLSKASKSKRVKTKTGRGGPTILDSMALESPQALLSSGSLRQFLYNNSDNYYSTVAQLEDLSQKIARNHTIWRQTPTIIPLRSRALSDRYGMRTDPFTKKREYHAGIDFRARRGTPVYAPADGVVRTASRKSGFGLLVELQHGRGFFPGKKKSVRYRTRFAHLSKIKVRRGQQLKRGDILGLVGSTGRSTGPHLHYEIIINGRRTDPLLPISSFNPDQSLYYRH
ncbi:MAG: M23 family metallopeptidase [SAR324 cluster bacterium]|nr:M23 family metallopeptidase [SAR324 cluster bacterium]MBL7035766.1 M23 family metallopeptidase [SAR324 cluster bacterium]